MSLYLNPWPSIPQHLEGFLSQFPRNPHIYSLIVIVKQKRLRYPQFGPKFNWESWIIRGVDIFSDLKRLNLGPSCNLTYLDLNLNFCTLNHKNLRSSDMSLKGCMLCVNNEQRPWHGVFWRHSKKATIFMIALSFFLSY